jgi:hypothetical protein
VLIRDGRTFVYQVGGALPNIRLPWSAADGSPIDFTAGYTLTATLRHQRTRTLAPTPPTVTGGVGYVDVVWPTTGLPSLVGPYTLRVRAVENATSKARDFDPGRPVTVLVQAA